MQYAKFMWAALHGEFGISYRLARPVDGPLRPSGCRRRWNWRLTASAFALLVGVPMGVYTGIRRGAVSSRLFMVFSLVGVSLPTFLIGILLILVFSVWLQVAAVASAGATW